MTVTQLIAVATLCLWFSGSIALGLWYRRDDERRFTMQAEEARRLRRERIAREDDAGLFKAFLNQYYAEVELFTRTYHGIAISQGEDAAELWFEEQMGRKPPKSGLEGGR